MIRRVGATWRSGYATVCKTVYTSSILVVASTSNPLILQRYSNSRSVPGRVSCYPFATEWLLVSQWPPGGKLGNAPLTPFAPIPSGPILVSVRPAWTWIGYPPSDPITGLPKTKLPSQGQGISRPGQPRERGQPLRVIQSGHER